MGNANIRLIVLELAAVTIILLVLAGLTLMDKQTSNPDGNYTTSTTQGTKPTTTSTQTTTSSHCPANSPPEYNTIINLSKACRFLENQELDSTGLLVASNGDNPDSRMIYLTHDNYLAMKALDVCKSGLADKIRKVLGKYDITSDTRYSVLFGKPYNFSKPPNNLEKKIVGTIKYANKTYTIAIDRLNTSSPLVNWTGYADWVALMGINYLLKGNTSGTLIMYSKLLDIWDGYGFNDSATGDTYSTYKVALTVYMTRLMKSYGLDVNHTLLEEWLGIIRGLQALDGGFYTNYRVINGTVIHAGSENVETTSLTIISLYYKPRLSNC